MTLSIIDIANIPCISGATGYLQSLDINLNDICTHRIYESIRIRAKEKVIEALQNGAIKYRRYNKPSAETELLSYPVSRILISCISSPYLVKRYALAVAKLANEHIKDMKNDALREAAACFGIDISFERPTMNVILHFIDYIHYASMIHAPEWDLRNRTVEGGMLRISRDELARLMEEAVREKVESGLPHEVPQDMREALSPYVAEIQEALNARSNGQNFNRDGFGEVAPDCFPPCISSAISDVQANVNLSHTMRFAMTAFLLNIGMKPEMIMEIFRASPDFKENATSYQIDHIGGASGKAYICPSCATMATNGNCPGKAACKRTEHPLALYRKRVWIMNKKKTTGG